MTKVLTAFKVAQFIPTPSRKKGNVLEIFIGHLNSQDIHWVLEFNEKRDHLFAPQLQVFQKFCKCIGELKPRYAKV